MRKVEWEVLLGRCNGNWQVQLSNGKGKGDGRRGLTPAGRHFVG